MENLNDKDCQPAGEVIALRKQNVLVTEALAATQQAVITLSAKGSILFCTEPARLYLAEYFKSSKHLNRHLPAKLRQWLRRRKPVASRNTGIPPPCKPFVLERKRGKLTVYLLSGRTAGRQILLLEEQRAVRSVELLQKHLGLTPREAAVLFWVSQGKMNAGIGILLGSSTGTIEKHLEHILAKLKVETRTAAALYAYEVLNGIQDKYRATRDS